MALTPRQVARSLHADAPQHPAAGSAVQRAIQELLDSSACPHGRPCTRPRAIRTSSRHRPPALAASANPGPLNWAGSACPAPAPTLPPPTHRTRPGRADVRPDRQYHDPPDNQTSTPAQRPRSTAQQAKYYQSNLTEPHRTGQPRTSPTPTGQGTPTGRTRPCFKVAPGPPKDRRTAEDSPRMQQQSPLSTDSEISPTDAADSPTVE
jgi:hypothetical protein